MIKGKVSLDKRKKKEEEKALFEGGRESRKGFI